MRLGSLTAVPVRMVEAESVVVVVVVVVGFVEMSSIVVFESRLIQWVLYRQRPEPVVQVSIELMVVGIVVFEAVVVGIVTRILRDAA